MVKDMFASLMTSGAVTSTVNLSTSRVWYDVDRQQLSTYLWSPYGIGQTIYIFILFLLLLLLLSFFFLA